MRNHTFPERVNDPTFERLRAAELQAAILRDAIEDMLSNLGVPQPGCPAPVAEAYRIGAAALCGEDWKERKT